MDDTLARLKKLVERGKILISNHGYDELAQDGLFVRDLVTGMAGAELLENYPDYPKGPCVLLLQRNPDGTPIHAVWGIPRGENGPAVLVTAYLPDSDRWTDGFRRRRK